MSSEISALTQRYNTLAERILSRSYEAGTAIALGGAAWTLLPDLPEIPIVVGALGLFAVFKTLAMGADLYRLRKAWEPIRHLPITQKPFRNRWHIGEVQTPEPQRVKVQPKNWNDEKYRR